MAKVHFVKAARKDNPVAKKGESYYWWKPMVGGRGGAKRFSKERPKPSQLTQSEFLSRLYEEQESLDAATDAEGMKAVAEAIRELGEEQQGKYDNMPEGLQQGETGQLLEERAQGCQSWADEIDTAADELETKIGERQTLREAWEAFDEDPSGDEPDEERPDDDDQDLIDEAREAASSSCPF